MKIVLTVYDLYCCMCSQASAGDIMIRNIQLRHAGRYTCAVQTKVDSASIATDVVVRGNASRTIKHALHKHKDEV